MSDAASTDAPSHEIQVHPRADAELKRLGKEFAIDELKQRIREASREREPRKHHAVDGLEGDHRLWKVRGDGVRAVCALAEPVLLVLLVGKRRTVYDRLSVAQARLRDWEGDIHG